MDQPLQRLALVGTSFRRVGFERLGSFVLGPEETGARRRLAAALGAAELVELTTCNRAEWYLVCRSRPAPEALTAGVARFLGERGVACAPADLDAATGAAAAERLFATAASLDSFVVGESDIARQVRRAAERAREEELAGPFLARLFERAALCARRVRATTALGSTHVSVASLAVAKIRKHFGKAGPKVSLLVGAGPMTRKVARALDGTPGERLLVNRSLGPARELASRYGGRAATLDELRRAPPEWIDLVFTATSAPEPVISAALLEPALAARERAGQASPLVICDLGVPRDVDPALADRPGVLLVSLAQLEPLARGNDARLAEEVRRAGALVTEEVARLTREEHFRGLAQESARAILESRLAHLDPGDRQAILRFTAGLAERFARQPVSATSGSIARGAAANAPED